MKKVVVAAALLLASAASAKAGGSGLVKECKEGFARDFPGTTVQDMMESPIKGLCEVHAGVNVFYYQPQKEKGLMMVGQIYTPTGDNLTLKVKEGLEKKAISLLPYDKAIKAGSGPVRVVVFTDPDCPYCRDLERAFSNHPEVFQKATVYSFLFPLERIHPQSKDKSRWIFCQQDPSSGMERVMLGGELDKVERVVYPDTCKLNQVEDRLFAAREAAQMMAVTGTPTVYVNGERVSGPDKIIAAIEAAAQSK